MRRVVALSLLCLIALFVGAIGVDACDEADGDCPPGCHVSCRDGCGSAPVTASERLQPATSLEHDDPVSPVARPLERANPPEIAPPRS